ncbi:MAG: GntR family transcriptional regulator [Clostridia bacterium]|nr:GntR family transcriptional regulator [Clostridia bacterium]
MAYDFTSGIPLYRQIITLFEQKICAGEYGPGQELPPVREVAMLYAVNPNTVQKAFAELDRLGVTETRRTTGRFVTTDSAFIDALREQNAKEEIKRSMATLAKLGLDQKTMKKLWLECQEEKHD